jgi:hypothetical protein
MTRNQVVASIALLAMLAGTAWGGPKKKKKKKKRKKPAATERAPEPEAEQTPDPEVEIEIDPDESSTESDREAKAPSEGTDDETPGEKAEAPAGEVTETAEASTEGPAAPAGPWPKEIIKRPPTLMKGLIRADAGMSFFRVTYPPVPPSLTYTTVTSLGLSLGVGYGVSDVLEVGGRYSFAVQEFEAKGPFTLYGAYALTNTPKMKAAALGAFTYDLLAETGTFSLGVLFQYYLNNKAAVYTQGQQYMSGGQPGQLRATLMSPEVGGMPGPKPIDLSLPVGLAYQLDQNIYAFFETSLATLNLSDSATALIFADIIPLAVGGFYSMDNHMEIGAVVALPDVPNAGDAFAISVVARMFRGDPVKRAATQ